MELEQEYRVKVPATNLDRLMAVLNILTSNEFFGNLPTFISICNVLSGDRFDPTQFDPADAEECAWGITEALILVPPEDVSPDGEAFSDEIRAYIGKMVSREGIITPPDMLQIAIQDSNSLGAVHQDYSDDPAMYGAIFELEQEKTEEINRTIRMRLKLLTDQLEQLPMKNGDVTAMVEKMRRSLQEVQEAGDRL